VKSGTFWPKIKSPVYAFRGHDAGLLKSGCTIKFLASFRGEYKARPPLALLEGLQHLSAQGMAFTYNGRLMSDGDWLKGAFSVDGARQWSEQISQPMQDHVIAVKPQFQCVEQIVVGQKWDAN
jgi:hypothetical protein